MIEYSSVTIGLVLLVLSCVLFAVLLPRGGRAKQVLIASDMLQSSLMMALTLMFLVGAALVVFGFPVGTVLAK